MFVKSTLGAAALAGLAIVTVVTVGHPSLGAQRGARPAHGFPLDDDHFLRWPLPPGQETYGKIDGKALKKSVVEIAAIAAKYRDEGNRYWGRLPGTSGDRAAEAWVVDKFQKIGLEVKRQEYNLPPQWFATAWDFTVTAGGKTLKPVTARPGMNSAPTSASGLDLEAVWVGLGTVSDFAGRDVRGKAVVIHSWPSPGVINNSAFTYGSIQRAVEKGAGAVIVNLAIPGNVDAMTFARIPTAAGGGNNNVPVFSLGSNDTTQLRELMEAGPVKIHLQLTTETRTGLKEHGVWGILPGATDEDIIVQAHHDSVFYGSLDNASGMAVMVGMAEYFAKIPKAQRRRTIRFESSVHHPGNVASIWLHDNRATELAKTALSINCEHVAAVQTNWNRYEGGQLLRTTNNVARRWWVGGSPKLANIVLNAFQMFGLGINETMDTSAPGTMSNHSLDVPSMQIIESAIYYHTDHDTPDFIPAAALESVARAFSKVIDDVNKVDRKDLLATVAQTSSSGPQR